MFNLVRVRWCFVACSLLVGCGGGVQAEEFEDVGQTLDEPPPLPTLAPRVLPPLPPVETLATDVRPTSIALDGSNVYYTDTFNLTAEVAFRPLAGGAKTVLHTTFTLPSSIVRHGSAVYWVNFTNTPGDGGVWTAPVSGASPAVKLAAHTNPVTAHHALAPYTSGAGWLSVTHVLYGDAWASKLYDVRRSLFGTSEASLVPDAIFNYYPFTVAIDSTHIYFTHDTGNGLWRVPFAGGAPTLLVASEEQPGAMTVAGGRVYFVKDGDIQSVPVAGGAPATFVTGVGTVQGLVAANGNLYWACSSCNTIRKKALAGGASTLLAAGHANLRSLAVDATHVYFGTNNALKRAPN